MPGLDPGIHALEAVALKGVDTRDKRGHDGGAMSASLYHSFMQKGGWVYIMSNGHNGMLYCGVTSDLARRVWQHREGLIDGFTKRYGLKALVWYEWHDDIRRARRR
jgi:putative endonuclease